MIRNTVKKIVKKNSLFDMISGTSLYKVSVLIILTSGNVMGTSIAIRIATKLMQGLKSFMLVNSKTLVKMTRLMCIASPTVHNDWI